MSECLFCKIANKEIPSEIIYEDQELLAFKDIAPKAPIHVLIIPKKHIPSLLDLAKTDPSLAGKIIGIIPKIALELNVASDGFRLAVNQGDFAGQAVPHVHFHILGGRKLTWPPG